MGKKTKRKILKGTKGKPTVITPTFKRHSIPKGKIKLFAAKRLGLTEGVYKGKKITSGFELKR